MSLNNLDLNLDNLVRGASSMIPTISWCENKNGITMGDTP